MAPPSDGPGDRTEILRAIPRIPGYSDLRQIGKGSFATVYSAVQDSLSRQVALKIMELDERDLQDVGRFKLEAQCLARLAHPGILPIYDVETFEDKVYIACELVEGGTMRSLLQQRPEFVRANFRIIAAALAGALGAAHREKILHRDLKPANVLMRSPLEPLLSDFGLAVMTDRTHITEEGVVMGTPEYMAPETIRGDAATIATDLYSLACLLYQLLTGRLPFVHEHIGRVLHAHLNDTPVNPAQLVSGVDSDIARLIMHGLRKKPQDRWPSADWLADALNKDVAIPDSARTVQAHPVRDMSPPTPKGVIHVEIPESEDQRIRPEQVALMVIFLCFGLALGHWLARRQPTVIHEATQVAGPRSPAPPPARTPEPAPPPADLLARTGPWPDLDRFALPPDELVRATDRALVTMAQRQIEISRLSLETIELNDPLAMRALPAPSRKPGTGHKCFMWAHLPFWAREGVTVMSQNRDIPQLTDIKGRLNNNTLPLPLVAREMKLPGISLAWGLNFLLLEGPPPLLSRLELSLAPTRLVTDVPSLSRRMEDCTRVKPTRPPDLVAAIESGHRLIRSSPITVDFDGHHPAFDLIPRIHGNHPLALVYAADLMIEQAQINLLAGTWSSTPALREYNRGRFITAAFMLDNVLLGYPCFAHAWRVVHKTAQFFGAQNAQLLCGRQAILMEPDNIDLWEMWFFRIRDGARRPFSSFSLAEREEFLWVEKVLMARKPTKELRKQVARDLEASRSGGSGSSGSRPASHPAGHPNVTGL